MLRYEEISDVSRKLIHTHLDAIQWHLARIRSVDGAAPLVLDLAPFKAIIDLNYKLKLNK